MNYRFRRVDLPPIGSPPNAVVFAIMGLLREKGRLPFPMDDWKWRAAFKSKGVLSENWLPMYEAVRRRWTRDRRIIADVSADPIFADMLANNVTFMDDEIFKSSLAPEQSENYRLEQRAVQAKFAEQPKVFWESLIDFELNGYDDPEDDPEDDF